jgi:hypothetical protein
MKKAEKHPPKPVVFLSIDVEADGPIPGVNSMLSYGVAAFNESGNLKATFTDNLELLEGAVPDNNTMAWWSGRREAWEACRKGLVHPAYSMNHFRSWLQDIGEMSSSYPKYTVIGYPVTYDFMWLYWYWHKFLKVMPPFSFSGLDIKTFAMSLLHVDFHKVGKRSMPDKWFSGRRHTHVALDDAIEQGELFFKMRHDWIMEA